MSDDETIVFLVCVVLSCVMCGRWALHKLAARRFLSTSTGSGWVGLGMATSVGMLWWILRHYASFDVKESLIYLIFYMVIGITWIGAFVECFPLLDLFPRDDVFVRGNRSAAYATSGGILALALCFAGGNIGDGPGWWVVLPCGLLSTVGLFTLWTCYALTTGVMHGITVMRDPASGVRLAGFLIACGLILGRSVAGDWLGWDEAVLSFLRQAWPSVGVLIVAIVAEYLFRPTREAPQKMALLYGVPVLIVDIVLAVYSIRQLGWWDHSGTHS